MTQEQGKARILMSCRPEAYDNSPIEKGAIQKGTCFMKRRYPLKT